MRQLVQLKSDIKQFEEYQAEVIAVFREEELGLEGLAKIKESTKVPFTLAIDLGAKKTASYSSGKSEFDNYVIDSNGVVRSIIDGTLKTRAKSKQILKVLEEQKGNPANAK